MTPSPVKTDRNGYIIIRLRLDVVSNVIVLHRSSLVTNISHKRKIGVDCDTGSPTYLDIQLVISTKLYDGLTTSRRNITITIRVYNTLPRVLKGHGVFH